MLNKKPKDKEQEDIEIEQDELDYEIENNLDSDNIESKIKKLKKQLKDCNQEKIDYLNSLQRLKADYVNLKKRNEEDVANLKDFASIQIIIDFISVLDTFDMAFKDEDQWNQAPENWRKGIEYIHTQFKNVLSDNNVTEINQIGVEFDHELHDATGTIDVESEDEDNTVKEILLKGYKYKDKIIRPAKIKVGKIKKN